MTTETEDKQNGFASNSRNEGTDLLGQSGDVAPGDVMSDAYDKHGVGTTHSVRRDPAQLALMAVLHYKWSFLVVSVLLSLITVPAIWLLVVPKYRARAVVRVAPVGTKIAFNIEDNGMVPFYKSFLNTQVMIIRGTPVLERVLDDPQVQATEWYRNAPARLIGAPPATIERLLEDLAVAPRPNTELIDVAMTALKAGETKLIADTVVDVYQAYSSELATATEIVRLETLLGEKEALEREIDGLVATRSHLTAQAGAADPVERLSQASARLTALESERDVVDRRLALARWELEAMSKARSSSGEGKARSAPEPGKGDEPPASGVATSPAVCTLDSEWRHLKSDLAGAQHALELGRMRLGPLHPTIAELEQSVAFAERLLSEREDELVVEARMLRAAPAGSGNALAAYPDEQLLARGVGRLSNELALLDTTIERVKVRVKEFGQLTKDMSRYDEELRHKRETYGFLRTRVEELSLERKAPARIMVAGYSVKPTRPSSDHRLMLTVMAVFGSFALALGLSYVRLVMDPTIRDHNDVRGATQATQLLGHLPPLPEACEILTSCTPMLLEHMRMVRTAMLERMQPARNVAILVTSSSSRAGKTSVSILLAHSLASLGKRTLLVDADLRRPSIAARLSIEPRDGLANILAGKVSDEDAILSPPNAQFDILPAGYVSGSFSPDILANDVMASAIERWKRRYDFVVLDSPPAPPVADARILGGLCDGSIMVVRSSHCRRTEVANTYGSLIASGGSVLGAVLIGDASRDAYYDYYGDYYRFRSDRSHVGQLGTDSQVN